MEIPNHKYNLISKESFANILKWSMVDIIKFMLSISNHNRNYPQNMLLVPYNYIPVEIPNSRYTEKSDFIWLGKRKSRLRDYQLQPFDVVKKRLYKDCPYLQYMNFTNYVIAGSAPLLYTGKYMTNDNMPRLRYSPKDFDIFLYSSNDNTNIDNNINTNEDFNEKYTNCLKDIQESVEKYITNYRIENGDIKTSSPFSVGRHTKCTNIVVNSPKGYTQFLQVVHKYHKTKEQVVASFDLSPCKTFFDGNMIYFTIDAALSQYFRINPLDWRTESSSYINRIHKYLGYDYSVIIPNLSRDLIANMKPEPDTLYDMKKISLKLRSSSYRVKNKQTNTETKRTEYYVEFYDKGDYGEPDNNNDNNNDDYDEGGVLISNYYSQGSADHILCLLLSNKYDFISVIANKPLDVINNFDKVDFKPVLKTMNNSRQFIKFYGDKICYKFYKKSRKICGSLPISDEDLIELSDHQVSIRRLLDERVKYFDQLVEPVYEKLKEINPISFPKIKRNNCKELWGDKTQPFVTTFLYQEKITMLLCLNRLKEQKVFPYSFMCRNLIKIILFNIDEYCITESLNSNLIHFDELNYNLILEL